MCVGTENIEEAPNLRARDKNTSGNNWRPYVFVIVNEPTTLQYVLDKYNYGTRIHCLNGKDTRSIQEINEDYQQNKEELKFAWIQFEISDMRGKTPDLVIQTFKEIIKGQKEQDKPIVIVMNPAMIKRGLKSLGKAFMTTGHKSEVT